ncbi:MAG: pyridoxal 5'-phosphate synthase lyase subunit PdxS [Candidatus Hodarchaeales archaeon]|jgi:pyridoxal 5'-phosphate synthase pdxS subunit
MLENRNPWWQQSGIASSQNGKILRGTTRLKRGFAAMTKGGVIMDVTNAQQAAIAEDAGAVSVMVLDKLPADVRRAGGVARTASVSRIREILEVTTIPVMAKCRIGHVEEAKMLQAVGIDMIDESEVLTPADEAHHVWKWPFQTPFVNGARELGEALRRIEEGAAMIRTKGEAGTGNIVEAVRHIRKVNDGIRELTSLVAAEDYQCLVAAARDMRASFEIAHETGRLGRLPVVNFAAGGIATPSDAALMMQFGCDGVFVGSGIYKSEDPEQRAQAIVLAVNHYTDPAIVLEAQEMVDETKAMPGLEIKALDVRLQERGAEI